MKSRFVHLMLAAAMLLVFVGMAWADEAAKEEKAAHDYIGVKKCKVCHKKDGTFESWEATAHATAFAGLTDEGGDYRSMSIMKSGDFFGEIAALTGEPRSADVVTTEDSILLKITAHALRRLMSNPAISQLFLTTLRERQTDVRISDMPRFTGYHQGDLRELRTAG